MREGGKEVIIGSDTIIQYFYYTVISKGYSPCSLRPLLLYSYSNLVEWTRVDKREGRRFSSVQFGGDVNEWIHFFLYLLLVRVVRIQCIDLLYIRCKS